MRAEIVMIGTELLLGELVDTNANRLAKALRDIGVDLFYKTTVGDNEDRITAVIDQALDRAEVVITSGGIGPTVDDVTRQAVARATGRALVHSEVLEAQIAERFASFGRPMSENNRRQAYLPEGALPIENPVGTAPCFLSEDTRGRGFVIVLPGVPRELQHLVDHAVKPALVERMGGAMVTRVRVLRTCAVGESQVDRAIGDLMTNANPTVGLAAHAGQTDVRIAAKAASEQEADALIEPMEREIRDRLGVAIYGVGEESLAEVLGRLLEQRGLTLGVIDTMTGGRVTKALAEAGYESLLAPGMDGAAIAGDEGDPDAAAVALAVRAASKGGMGLALAGTFAGNETRTALVGPGSAQHVERGRNFQDSDHFRTWHAIQGMDLVRRVVLGQLRSGADWC